MKNSNWILVILAVLFICAEIRIYLGMGYIIELLLFAAFTATYFIIQELEKLNDKKSSKKSEEFAKNFGDWLKYESVCFPEHKDKSIEELLEIYKKSI